MTMTGHQFEHFVAEVFRGNGWQAQVTPGSGDYGVDVVLTGPNPIGRTVRVAVQVKMHASAVGPKAVQEVHTGKSMHRCEEEWWSPTPHSPPPRLDLPPSMACA